MNEIKFNNDYEKLPENWHNSKAELVGVYPTTIQKLSEKSPAFLKKDTKIVGKDEHFDLTDYSEVLLLTFLHYKSGELIGTIRKNKNDKFEDFVNKTGEVFVFKDTRKIKS